MPKVSTTPQATAADLSAGSLQLIGYDSTAPAGSNVKRVSPADLQGTPKWQKITTFLNNWAKMAGQPELAICKTSAGVLLQGSINGGALDTGNFQTPAFTVPTGYRPVTEPFWIFPVLGNLAASPIPLGCCVIMPNGNAHILAPNNAAIVFPCQGDRSFF